MLTVLSELVWYSPRLWPAALIIAALIATAVIWLYGPQVRMLGQPWRWLLPLLRTLALIALVLSMLKPVAIRHAAPEEAGGVLVVVDRSKSMGIHDMSHVPQDISKGQGSAGAAQLVALADGVGLLHPGMRDAVLVGLHRDVEKLSGSFEDLTRARSELDFSRVSGQGVDAAQSRVSQATDTFKSGLVQLASQASSVSKVAPLSDALAKLNDLSNQAPDAWAAGGPHAIATLAKAVSDAQAEADLALYKANTDVRAVCDQLAAMTRFQRVEMALTNPGSGFLTKFPAAVPLFGYSIAEDAQSLPLRGGGQPVRRLVVDPDGLESDLTGGIRAALSHLQGQQLQAIVVLSDGQQVGGDPSTASQLAASGVPIFSVYSANNVPLRDVAITRLSVPGSCFVNENVNARVDLRATGYEGNAAVVPVSISVDGQMPTTRPTALSSDKSVTQDFPMKFDKPGIHKIVATIPTPADAPTGENKQMERWIKVLSDKVQIGLYAGAPGWDFQYVRNALSRTTWVDLKEAILPVDNAKFPLTPDQILGLDLLVLFDVPAASLSDLQWDAVYKLVSERGGSVILVAGEEHIPSEYADKKLPSGFLPYLSTQKSVWRTWPGKEPGFHLIPAAGTETLDALKLDDTDAGSEKWVQLPAFYRFLSLPDLKPNAQALLVDRDTFSPVLLESRLGLGRSFFFGATETWRWRYKVGEKIQDRFWLQLVRYAADEPYAVQNKTMALDANLVSAEPGEPIRLRARVAQADGSPSADARQDVHVLKDGAELRTVALLPAGSPGSGRYRGMLSDLPAGDYQLKLDSNPPGESLTLPLHIAPSAEAEMANLNGSEQPLRRMAESSGGTFLPLDQIGTLPDLIAKSRSQESRLAQKPLWDSYYLFLFVLACFALEWAIRKRVGLV